MACVKTARAEAARALKMDEPSEPWINACGTPPPPGMGWPAVELAPRVRDPERGPLPGTSRRPRPADRLRWFGLLVRSRWHGHLTKPRLRIMGLGILMIRHTHPAAAPAIARLGRVGLRARAIRVAEHFQQGTTLCQPLRLQQND